MPNSCLRQGEACFLFWVLQVDCRIHVVHVFLIQFFPKQLDRLTEPLKMDNFPFPQELDYIVHIRVIAQPQTVVIGDPGFLLWERIA